MFEQLEYLRHHQPALGVFEQVPNFQLMHGGAFMREFVEALEALDYVVSHKTGGGAGARHARLDPTLSVQHPRIPS